MLADDCCAARLVSGVRGCCRPREPLRWTHPFLRRRAGPRRPSRSRRTAGLSLPPPPVRVSCVFCGGYPAVRVTLRRLNGLFIIMWWQTVRDRLCRACGVATFRLYQSFADRRLVEPILVRVQLVGARAERDRPHPARPNSTGRAYTPVAQPWPSAARSFRSLRRDAWLTGIDRVSSACSVATKRRTHACA